MIQWLFDPPAQPSLPIVGQTARFPVRRIFCLGQNYAAHAREMGSDPATQTPFLFSKPGQALVSDGANPAWPGGTENLHFEVELVCAIGESGKIVGCAVGVDLTRRDLQAQAKAAGRPWDAAKGFDQSGPCGALSLGPVPDPSATIKLSVNGDLRQSSTLGDMILNPDQIVEEAGRLWTLLPGDLIFTGTPEGVGPLMRGDRVLAQVEGLTDLEFTIV